MVLKAARAREMSKDDCQFSLSVTDLSFVRVTYSRYLYNPIIRKGLAMNNHVAGVLAATKRCAKLWSYYKYGSLQGLSSAWQHFTQDCPERELQQDQTFVFSTTQHYLNACPRPQKMERGINHWSRHRGR